MIQILLAQKESPWGGSFQGLGPLGETSRFITIEGALKLFFTVLSSIVGIITVIAAIWFVFQFFIGAIQIMTSSGDKTKMQEASGRITYAVIGIVIVISAIFLVSLIGSLMGLNILGPWEFITDLW